MVKLCIRFQSEPAAYLAGEQVNGDVTAQVDEPTKARRVCVEVLGRAFNRWYVHYGHNHSRAFQAEVKFIDVNILLWKPNDESDGILAPGNYCFPFSFVIPPNALPNHQNRFGTIDYWCRAKVERPWHSDDEVMSPFYVAMPNVDLNRIENAANPTRCNFQKELGCCFSTGVLSVQASLDKFGYIGGEQMLLSLDVDNASAESVTEVHVSITECWKYQASGNSSRCFTKDLLSLSQAVAVPPHGADRYQRRIKLPALQPSYECQITVHSFYVNISVATDGCSAWLHGQLPFYVGTVPIGGPRVINPSGILAEITTEAKEEAIRNVDTDKPVDPSCC
ncbi:Protein ARRD-11 [Aphelenchoides avenae]|nr:Protein ARRD-11 [Aphelenchus avenae]